MKAVLKVDEASELDIDFGLVLCLFLQYSNKFQNWFQPWTRFEGNIDSGVELGYTALLVNCGLPLHWYFQGYIS